MCHKVRYWNISIEDPSNAEKNSTWNCEEVTVTPHYNLVLPGIPFGHSHNRYRRVMIRLGSGEKELFYIDAGNTLAKMLRTPEIPTARCLYRFEQTCLYRCHSV